jgi:FkbM family methyltransferase
MANPVQKYSYYLWSILELVTGFKDPLLIGKIFLKLTPPGIKIIRLRGDGLAFRVRSAMDVWSLKETLLDRFYERCGTPIEDDWIIMDIGGGIGEFTLFAAQDHPGNMVFAFEPFPESLNLLKANLELNRITNVKAYGDAIWSKKGYLRIDTAPGEPSQFTSRESDANLPENDPTIVPAIPLADAFARLNLDDDEFDLYQKVYADLALQAPTPDLVIYLQAPLDALQERVKRRGVEYERSMDADYLQRLANTYSEFFHRYDAAPLLIVNTSHLNFAQSEADFELLLERMSKMRGPREFFNRAA